VGAGKVSGDLATIHKNILNFAAKLNFSSIVRAAFNTDVSRNGAVLFHILSDISHMYIGYVKKF
jgi:hypothetical protein